MLPHVEAVHGVSTGVSVTAGAGAQGVLGAQRVLGAQGVLVHGRVGLGSGVVTRGPAVTGLTAVIAVPVVQVVCQGCGVDKRSCDLTVPLTHLSCLTY